MLLGTSVASILENALARRGVIRAGERVIRPGHILMLSHLLNNFEMQKYNQNEPKRRKLHGVYSKNNLSKIKDGTYVINLDEYESIETRLILLYVNAENVAYFELSFRVENIDKK